LEPGETPSNSASHLARNYAHSKTFKNDCGYFFQLTLVQYCIAVSLVRRAPL